MPKAYEGNKPYIFISYSHKDTELVLAAIEALENHGFLVWFDGGIEAGSEWPEYIATHLRSSTCMISFISKSFVASKNCQRELVFAQTLDKPLLNVFIEDVELTDGMMLQLGLNQAIWGKNFPNLSQLTEAICRAKLLESCRIEAHQAEEPIQAPSPDPIHEEPQATQQEPSQASDHYRDQSFDNPAPQYTEYDNRYSNHFTANGYYQPANEQVPPYTDNTTYTSYNNYGNNAYAPPAAKLKDKPISIVLCLLLGIFGAHKFYEGKFVMGVLYLFTLGLFFVGVLYDLVELFHLPNQYYPKRSKYTWMN